MPPDRKEASIQPMWRRTLRSGRAAGALSDREELPIDSEAVKLGLLQRVGYRYLQISPEAATFILHIPE